MVGSAFIALAEDIPLGASTVWREGERLSALTMERSFTALATKDLRTRVGAAAGAVVKETVLAAYASVGLAADRRCLGDGIEQVAALPKR